jgi:predicted phosphodiesterase
MYAFLADIHIGCKLPNEDIMKSIDYYFNIIKEHDEPCHQIFICGDLFDHRLTVSELKFAAEVMVKLVCNKCGPDETDVPVTFIHGTYSHDQEQYMIFIRLIERTTGVRIRYIQSHASFKLDNGARVLALPQEYGDIDYREAFSSKYDIIIGHGPMSSMNDEPCPTGSTEIMMSAELLSNISNVCVFGHYHEFINFGGNVFYAGSMLRWKYGENKPKVFLTCTDDWKVSTHPNPYAMNYETKDIFSPDELRKNISTDIDHPVRFIIHVNKEHSLEEYHSIMNLYKKNKMISCRFISEKNEEQIERLSVDIKPHANVEPIPALITYIKDKYQIDPSDVIMTYNEKISKESE